MFKNLLRLGVLALCGAVMVGCNKSGNKATATSGPSELHLAFITNNASNFWTIARAGCEKAEQELPNVRVNFQIPSDGSAAAQTRIVNDLLAKGVDGISISPVDPDNETPLLNKVAGQCLLFCQDSDAPKSNRACYVGTNNVEAGKEVGGLIKKACPDGGKIMLFVGTLDAQNAKDRYDGIKDALKGSNITIIDVRTDDTDRARAVANAADTLVKYPHIACLVGLWSYNGPAIANAVKSADEQGKVKVVCFDGEDGTIAGIKDGTIYGTVVQQPFEFGRQAMTIMAKVLRGDKSLIPPSKQIYIPTKEITKANVDAYQARMNKLLGKT